jgi:hypothetical protein
VRDETKQEVRVLAGLLRVAIGLDRNHAGRVGALDVSDKGDRLIVRVAPLDGEDIDLELYAAVARAGLLESALDVRLEVREG